MSHDSISGLFNLEESNFGTNSVSPIERANLSQYLIRLADGDRKAFDPIFEATWPMVHNFALKLSSNSVEADDIAQTALSKVFSRATEFRRDGDALSWILGITAFECKTARKKVSRRKENFDQDNFLQDKADESENAEEKLIVLNLDEAIQEVLKGLSEQDQETIRIAIHELERPNIPSATFRKRLERAFGKLKDTWKDQYE